VQTAEHISMED